jgi:hypothetical protein
MAHYTKHKPTACTKAPGSVVLSGLPEGNWTIQTVNISGSCLYRGYGNWRNGLSVRLIKD